MNRIPLKAARFAAIAAASLAISATAFADTALLNLNGIDRTTPAGKAMAERRIAVALDTACGEGLVTGTRIRSREQAACRAFARRQIDERLAHTAEPAPLGG